MGNPSALQYTTHPFITQKQAYMFKHDYAKQEPAS